MVNHSSKLDDGMRQSIIAFIIMVLLIVVAGDISGWPPLPWDKVTDGYKLALAALPGSTPTPGQKNPEIIYQTSFIPLVARSHASASNLEAGQETPATEGMASQETPGTQEPADQQTPIQEIFDDLVDLLPVKKQANDKPQDEPDVLPEIVEVTQEETLSSPQPSGAAETPGFVDTVSTPITNTLPEPTLTPQASNFTEDEERTWEDYAGPSLWPDIEVPAPMGILSHPEDQVNILLLGSDQREGDYGFRTDTIQLLTLNPSQGTIKLTAFPRDLYVYIPGYTMERINTAFGWGGFDALADTMEYNFGVRPDYYVVINFQSFVDVIDSLGGVTVKVGQDLCDHRDAFGEFCVSQSDYWMNGETALWYVRARYTTSDLDRGRRQQEVLEAVFDKLISMDGLVRAPELYQVYKENVTTSLTFEQLMSFIPLAAQVADTHQIGRYSIGYEQVYDWVNYSGAMVLVPMQENVRPVMRLVLSEP